MERRFLRDVGKRFKAGQVCDFPQGTWNQIAVNVGEPLDAFSEIYIPGQPAGTPAKAMIEKQPGKKPLAQAGAT